MKKKYRFAPKVYGRGIVPIAREGWLLTFIIVLVIVGAGPLILGTQDNPGPERFILFWIVVFVVSLLPIYLLKDRVSGSLKWRRGAKDIDWEVEKKS